MDYLKDLYETNATPTTHHIPYPAISPTRTALSQAGKTVLVTGASTGIGLAIAHAYLQANAEKLIILSLRPENLEKAHKELEAAKKENGSTTDIVARVCNLGDVAQINALWDGFKADNTVVDVVVSNAVRWSKTARLFEVGAEDIWKQLETNVRGPLYLIERFHQQGVGRPKAFVNVSTNFVNFWQSETMTGRRAYGINKNACTMMIQQFAEELPPEEMQIVSFHPGLVWTEQWETVGVSKDALPFDDPSLPGAFAVWAASPEARFLHGRFVWDSWDVEELKTGELSRKITENPDFLKVAVVGMRLGNIV